jgi:hypothetical protein
VPFRGEQLVYVVQRSLRSGFQPIMPIGKLAIQLGILPRKIRSLEPRQRTFDPSDCLHHLLFGHELLPSLSFE